jgi:hypothetical protein
MALTNRKFTDYIFVISLLVVSSAIFGLIATSFNYINENCNVGPIYDSMVGILVISVGLFAFSIAYFTCTLQRECYWLQDNNTFSKVLVGFAFLVSLVLLILCVIIISALAKYKDCGDPISKQDKDNIQKFKDIMWIIFTISIFFLFGSIFVWYYDNFRIPSVYGDKESLEKKYIPDSNSNLNMFSTNGLPSFSRNPWNVMNNYQSQPSLPPFQPYQTPNVNNISNLDM